MAIDYGLLISLPELTEEEGDRLQEILDLACEDGALSFWISELDHIVAHQTGLLSSDCRKDYENKKAWLREHFMECLEYELENKSPAEVRVFLEQYTAKRKISNSSSSPGSRYTSTGK
ncbi:MULTISPECIES: hypothetical protein [Cyanophyceae]|uniref:hypothetical protein n=1 Tax=Cyanophyceae TaxID=3028117 RepID=UPI0016850191|nr:MULTISPECIES: hypothetical protein [Cyanophyceae]MBD1917275.1 hypothetical protein [Phormidium sp. FACHB-77]MBD2028491.1 hypothetical protein [Phormidium sp. FACHB-322]MBD2049672.1 hypothetical protein [Leptolyngbya sp. FACHB-60]